MNVVNKKGFNTNGWILCPSKTFPGKFYYFNVMSGETAWSLHDTDKQLSYKNEFPYGDNSFDNAQKITSPPLDTQFPSTSNLNTMPSNYPNMFSHGASNYVPNSKTFVPPTKIMCSPLQVPHPIYFPNQYYEASTKQMIKNLVNTDLKFTIHNTNIPFTKRFINYDNMSVYLKNNNTPLEINSSNDFDTKKEQYNIKNNSNKTYSNQSNDFIPFEYNESENKTKSKNIVHKNLAFILDSKSNTVKPDINNLNNKIISKMNKKITWDSANENINNNITSHSKLAWNDLRHTIKAKRRNSIDNRKTISYTQEDDEIFESVSTSQGDVRYHLSHDYTQHTKRQSPIDNTKCYLIVDSFIILNHFDYIMDFVRFDADHRLYIPYAVLTEIKSLFLEEFPHRTELLKAKMLMKKIGVNSEVICVQSEDDNPNSKHFTIETRILNCCQSLRRNKCQVILLTENINLRQRAEKKSILVYDIEEMISRQYNNTNFDINKIKNDKITKTNDIAYKNNKTFNNNEMVYIKTENINTSIGKSLDSNELWEDPYGIVFDNVGTHKNNTSIHFNVNKTTKLPSYTENRNKFRNAKFLVEESNKNIPGKHVYEDNTSIHLNENKTFKLPSNNTILNNTNKFRNAKFSFEETIKNIPGKHEYGDNSSIHLNANKTSELPNNTALNKDNTNKFRNAKFSFEETIKNVPGNHKHGGVLKKVDPNDSKENFLWINEDVKLNLSQINRINVDEYLEYFCLVDDKEKKNVLMRFEENLCFFTQIMEEVLMGVLMIRKPVVTDLQAPWFILEATELLRSSFAEDKLVTILAEKMFVILYDFIKKVNHKNNTAKSDEDTTNDILKLIGCGVILIRRFQIIFPNMEQLSDAFDSILSLKTSSALSEHSNISPTCDRLGGNCRLVHRSNVLKPPEEILKYLKKHFPSWKDCDKVADITDMQYQEPQIKNPTVIRTYGRHLNSLHLNKNKLTNNFEIQNDINKTFQETETFKTQTKVIRNINFIEEFEMKLNRDNAINDLDKINFNTKNEDTLFKDETNLYNDITANDTFYHPNDSLISMVTDGNVNTMNQDTYFKDETNFQIDFSRNNNLYHTNDIFNSMVTNENVDTKDLDDNQTHISVVVFLRDLGESFKMLYDFISTSYLSIQDSYQFEENQDQLRRNRAVCCSKLITQIAYMLQSIYNREASKNTSLIPSCVNIYGEDIKEKYSEIISNRLEQALIIKNSLDLLITLFMYK